MEQYTSRMRTLQNDGQFISKRRLVSCRCPASISLRHRLPVGLFWISPLSLLPQPLPALHHTCIHTYTYIHTYNRTSKNMKRTLLYNIFHFFSLASFLHLLMTHSRSNFPSASFDGDLPHLTLHTEDGNKMFRVLNISQIFFI